MYSYKITGYDLGNTNKFKVNSIFDGKTPIDALGKALKRKIDKNDIMPKDKFYPGIWMYEIELYLSDRNYAKRRSIKRVQLKDDFVISQKQNLTN